MIRFIKFKPSLFFVQQKTHDCAILKCVLQMTKLNKLTGFM